LPKRDPPDVTRFRSATAKRVQAHRARARMGLRCLTVRVRDRVVRHLISTGRRVSEGIALRLVSLDERSSATVPVTEVL
jgi:hypothetical protein